MTNKDTAFKVNKETKHGLRELRDFTNLFGYSGRTVSEMIGTNKKLTLAELSQKYPQGRAYIECVKNLTSYLRAHGSGVDVESYRFRIHHVHAMKEFLDVSVRMQFIKALDEQIQVYRAENIGWGILNIVPVYQNGNLISTQILLDDKPLDLSKPLRIQAVDWYGRLVDGIQLINKNEQRTTRRPCRSVDNGLVIGEDGNPVYEEVALPINLAIQITEDSVSNSTYIEALAERDGAINKTDMTESLLFSPLNFLVVRIADDAEDEKNDIMVTTYDTPIFKELDYSHDIDFVEHIEMLERISQFKDLDIYYNTREFAALNLCRWGIVDKKSWDRGLQIFNTVDKAPKLWGNDTPIDGRLTHWANECIIDLKSRRTKEDKELDIDDVIISGAHISKIANVLSQCYYKMRALVVDNIKEDDIEFRDTYITFRSKREISTKYQTVPRLNVDVYKIIECDKDGNFIRILDPVDVFAVVNHDITAVVVRFEAELVTREGVIPGEVKPTQEHQDYYNAIGAYKG